MPSASGKQQHLRITDKDKLLPWSQPHSQGLYSYLSLSLTPREWKKGDPGNEVEGKGISKLTVVFNVQYLTSGSRDHLLKAIALIAIEPERSKLL